MTSPGRGKALSALGATALMALQASAMSRPPNAPPMTPMDRFIVGNIYLLGIPALVVCGLVCLWNRWLVAYFTGRVVLQPTGQTQGQSPKPESSPALAPLSLALLGVWVCLVVVQLLSPHYGWFDLGAPGYPLTWAAIFGPAFLGRFWTPAKSGLQPPRPALLTLAIVTFTGIAYQIVAFAVGVGLLG